MSFAWPGGARAAVSFTFDDAQPSAAEVAAPLIAAHGFRATFFVLMGAVRQRPDAWRAVARAGHEIANHTRSHPCTGNFAFARDVALEDWTLERYAADVDAASDDIAGFFGARPRSFAYCCGQKFVGRGTGVRSTVPVIAERFAAGRGFRDEYENLPATVDPAQIAGVELDGLDLAAARAHLARARASGALLAFAGHHAGDGGYQTVRRDVLDALCRELRADGDCWVAPLAEVGAWLARPRGAAIE